jgi:hypothetical protein
VRLLLEAYRDADLARAAAAIIRGWADEEPRALWERLRAEGPPSESSKGTPVWNAHPPEHFADAMGGLPALPATITPDARRVDPREVARWAAFMVRTMPQAQARGATAGDFLPRIAPSGVTRYAPDAPAQGLLDLPTLPATITPDARSIEPGPDLPPGTVAYMDPPYVGTTGYGHDLPRSEVVALARRWAAAGATVAISEAEPIADLTAEGWHAVRVDGERRGQKRTFSKQQAEWVTMNRPPAWTPPEQRGLFA